MPLLSGIWEESKVRFDDNGNLVVSSEEGAYMLLTMNYKTDVQRFVGKVCDKKVVFEQIERVNESDIDRQLEGLGNNVKFDDPKNRF